MIKGSAADPDLHLMLTFAEHYPAGCCIPLYVPVIDAQAVGYIAHRQVGAPILDIRLNVHLRLYCTINAEERAANGEHRLLHHWLWFGFGLRIRLGQRHFFIGNPGKHIFTPADAGIQGIDGHFDIAQIILHRKNQRDCQPCRCIRIGCGDSDLNRSGIDQSRPYRAVLAYYVLTVVGGHAAGINRPFHSRGQ